MPKPRREPKPIKYDVPAGFSKEQFESQWARIQAINQERLLAERKLVLLQQELDEAWKKLPATVQERRWLPCLKCGDKTQDRFGPRAMCAKHVAKGDEAIAGILADVLYGDAS